MNGRWLGPPPHLRPGRLPGKEKKGRGEEVTDEKKESRIENEESGGTAGKKPYTLGSQPGRYSRDQWVIASRSPAICPVRGSTRSVRPVLYEMLPRWQSSVLLKPSAISAFSGALPRIA